MQRTCPSTGFVFEHVEQALRNDFIPALFGVDSISGEDRELISHSVRRGGFAIRNPVDTAIPMYGASKAATAEMVASMCEGKPLNLEQHQANVKEASMQARIKRANRENAYLQKREEEKGPSEKWRIKRSCHSGCWLACFPSWLNGTILSRNEFRDNCCLRMNWMPEHLPECCDGCGAKMTAEHALSCRVGGFVHIRHDIVADEFGYLGGCAFQPSRVIHEPVICSGTPCEADQEVRNQMNRDRRRDSRNMGDVDIREEETADQTHNPKPRHDNENRGDKSIIGFWQRGA